mgnify:CR=1 FL=1
MTRKEEKELTRRMLLVEDPVEMKCDPGTEILVGTTPDEDNDEDKAGHHHRNKPDHHRAPNVHVLGVGEVSSTPVPGRRR